MEPTSSTHALSPPESAPSSSTCNYHQSHRIVIMKSPLPIIKPISDLRNKANEISELVHTSQEPIFITKNGEGNMVVMSMAHYARMQMKIDLLTKLGAAQSQLASGQKGRTLRQVMSSVRKKLRER